jgi:ABC-type polysaccharide/polyol phosphate transport system ATPase subunit
VDLQSLAIRYRVPRERVGSLKEFAIRWIQRRIEYTDLWALRALDLAVGRGEIFGVIGPNGAGKSTLLKAIAGVLHPTQGRVIVRGRVAPLLELGAGFHPELTGRENVYLYGTLLGNHRRELASHFDRIVAFAELDGFIDAPLRTYSTGMIARLGFAVATSRFADVLLVDEVLAVGDAHFQAKCLARMQLFRERGATILFVSHDLATISSLCQRALWLDGGRAVECGRASDVVEAYIVRSRQAAR